MGSPFCVFCLVFLSAMQVAEEKRRCGRGERAAWKRRKDDVREEKMRVTEGKKQCGGGLLGAEKQRKR